MEIDNRCAGSNVSAVKRNEGLATHHNLAKTRRETGGSLMPKGFHRDVVKELQKRGYEVG
jgi:hypothetical protein